MANEAVNVELAIREEPAAVMLTNRQLQVIANTDFVPKALRGNVPAVLACVARGRAMGIPDMVALNGIAIIEGKATLTAELMEGIVRAHGHSITGTVTATEAVLRGKRKDNGDEMEVRFDLEMAERAGLLNKMSWKKHPDDMLFARAVSKLCRRLFADCFAGGTYVPEEVGPTADEVIDDPPERPLDVRVPDSDIDEGILELSEDPPVPSLPAEPPDEVAEGAAASGHPLSQGGTSQPAGGGVPPGTTAPPSATGIHHMLPDQVKAGIAGETVIPSGKYRGHTIADVAGLIDGAEWFMAILKARDSGTRRAAVEYARAFMPDVWARYEESVEAHEATA